MKILIYWSEQSFAGLGPEEQCSSRGLHMHHTSTLNSTSCVIKCTRYIYILIRITNNYELGAVIKTM